MGRALAVGLTALVAAIGLGPAAVAQGRAYEGSLGSGSLTFKIEHHKLTSFKFLSVPITCKSGGETASGRDAADSFDLDGGRFHASLHASNPQFSGRIVLRGHLSGGSASGAFSLRGNRVPIDGGGTGHGCDTGTLHWTAS